MHLESDASTEVQNEVLVGGLLVGGPGFEPGPDGPEPWHCRVSSYPGGSSSVLCTCIAARSCPCVSSGFLPVPRVCDTSVTRHINQIRGPADLVGQGPLSRRAAQSMSETSANCTVVVSGPNFVGAGVNDGESAGDRGRAELRIANALWRCLIPAQDDTVAGSGRRLGGRQQRRLWSGRKLREEHEAPLPRRFWRGTDAA